MGIKMKGQRIKLNIIFGCIAALCAGLPVAAFFLAREFALVCAIVCVAVAALAAALILKTDSYTDSVIMQLSELIASISTLDAAAVAPEYEDSLLSKLQSQTVKLTEMLTEQNRKTAAEKDEIKSLISDISHQLKTPVATLHTYGELLLESNLCDDSREVYLTAFSAAVEKLTFLTDSMIKLSRLESGIIVIKPDYASLNATVLVAVKQAFAPARKKGIEIAFDSDGCEVSLTHDEKWTQEAIFNILDNAIKYTPAGGRVTISLCKYEMFARLDIADTGIGIPESEHAKVFGRFYRGTNVSDEDGVGIGLYLTRKIITQQGGYVKLKSDKSGSVFSVFLPLER